MINIDKLFKKLSLGTLESKPVSVSGGILHNVYEVNTTQGKYAVKILNPYIIKTKHSLQQIEFSETVARIAGNNGANAISAIEFNGKSIQKSDGKNCLIYHWFEGKSVTPNSVDVDKCAIIGKLLAEIHNLDYSSITNKCKDGLVISHKDILQKNVLWNKNNIPMIIDWESAGYINPNLELLDTALFWSGGHKDIPDTKAFNSFIKSYFDNGGCPIGEMNRIFLERFINKLEWLEFNVKKSLGIDCDDINEQNEGSRYAKKAIESIHHYNEIMPILMEMFKTAINQSTS